MSLSLNSLAIEEKNKLSTDSVFLVALKIDIPGLADPVRVINNSENFIWKGETWIAFPFTIDELSDQAGKEIPTVTISLSNVNRVMEIYLEQYDTYIKTNGFSPITVEISVINTAVIAVNGNADAEVTHYFQLRQPKTNSKTATFILSADNPFMRRFPQNRILKNHCRFIFKDVRCQYSGVETSCSKTLTRCRELNNSLHFGGAPGVGRRGLEIDSTI